MKIVFETLRFKNVLSYGNRISEFNFKNGIDLVVGSNGLGKSTFVDALTYGLFGKPFRKIKIKKLINDKNARGLWVEVVFSVNGNRFKVERSLKPDTFEISKETDEGYIQIEKPSTNRDYQILLEETILQFGENVYRQLIALGANLDSSKNFMDLSKSEKEEVLQVITDTGVFNKVKEKVREQKLVEKTNLSEYTYKKEVQSSTLTSIQSNIRILERQNSEFDENKEEIISQLNDEAFDLSAKLDKYPTLFQALEKIEYKFNTMKPMLEKLNSELSDIVEREHDIKAKIRQLLSNEKSKVVCPKCDFEIKDDLPYTSSDLKVELSDIIVEKTAKNDEIESLESSMRELSEKFNNKGRLKRNEQEAQLSLDNINDRLEKTRSWKSVDIDYTELKSSEEEFDRIKSNLMSINGKLTDLNDLEDMVSDKNLKGVILNQQLPFLNKYINEFLELFGSKFNFVIDNEFQEKIISRSSENDFNSLSNGQKQRISLSILFAFLKLIEEKNGISTNLLILDEYLDSSLDVEGTYEVMTILDEVFCEKKDVVLISHNQEIKNRLDLLNRIIVVKQESGFSSFSVEDA